MVLLRPLSGYNANIRVVLRDYTRLRPLSWLIPYVFEVPPFVCSRLAGDLHPNRDERRDWGEH